MRAVNIFLYMVLGIITAGLGRAADEKKASSPATPDKEVTFEMREVSAFAIAGTNNRNSYLLVRGQSAQCSTEPDKEVKAYPKLNSAKPLYGKVKFGRTSDNPVAGVEYHFVIDESGEKTTKPIKDKPAGSQPYTKEAANAKPGSGGSLLQSLVSALTGATTSTPPAAPIRPPTYDRLYFDANRDLDLTNDPVILPIKDPPAGANPANAPSIQTVIYDALAILFDYGPGLGKRPFRLLPRLMIQEYEGKQYPALWFVAATARQGRIRIGSQEYDAVLAQPYMISGRFDPPHTGMFLTRVGSDDSPESWWGADEVKAMRQIDGKYYSTSVTPLGDKLTVRPYRGDLGTLKLGAGKRDLTNLSMYGSLDSGAVAVGIGEPAYERRTGRKLTTECRLPVGDYRASFLTIEYGRLRIGLSNNYHSDGHPRDMAHRASLLFKIRKDRPFVLDFSNKPEVVFASPAKDQTLKPGDKLEVAAVLTDPKLDIMIRDLENTDPAQKQEYKLPDGGARIRSGPVSLDPDVTITNSSGKIVAQGKMPFG